MKTYRIQKLSYGQFWTSSDFFYFSGQPFSFEAFRRAPNGGQEYHSSPVGE